MGDVLAHPFRLTAGHVVTVPAESDDDCAQRYATLIQTRLGERPMVPAYGIEDPTFTGGFDVGAVTAAASTFGPDRRIVDVAVVPADQSRTAVIVTFD